ncbi:unnamed protein product [Lampetra planeri]
MDSCSATKENVEEELDIEISGLDKNEKTAEIKLLKYFQSKRLSNGGECRLLTWLPGNRVGLRFMTADAGALRMRMPESPSDADYGSGAHCLSDGSTSTLTGES